MVAKKTLMSGRQLPSELEEEILVRVPPLSLVRFRSVCKGWNTLFKDKRFVDRNFACGRPEILLKTHSHLYSISVDLNKDDPTIKVTDLRSDFRLGRYHHQGTCDGYYLFTYRMDEQDRCLVWNPLLNRAKWISTDGTDGYVGGRWMGYDGSRPEKVYKIIGTWNSFKLSPEFITRFAVLSDFATNAWKVFNHTSFEKEETMEEELESSRVCLNGNMYWTAYTYPEIGQYFIQMLDISKGIEKTFCVLPCTGRRSTTHTRILSIYKGDRFSVLQQHTSTRNIRIWVTEKKIGNGDDGDHVVWINFMTVSIPYFPIVVGHMSTSYFVENNIYGKSFVLCCPSKKPRNAWVYIVRGDMCKKIKIHGVVSKFQSSVYVPSLITIF